jgi:uncharacterized protein YjbJ (UPF0337 family)
MDLDDKVDNAAEKLGGKGKEAAGEATGDENLKAEGKGDQASSDLKQAGETVKDAFTEQSADLEAEGCSLLRSAPFAASS